MTTVRQNRSDPKFILSENDLYELLQISQKCDEIEEQNKCNQLSNYTYRYNKNRLEILKEAGFNYVDILLNIPKSMTIYQIKLSDEMQGTLTISQQLKCLNYIFYMLLIDKKEMYGCKRQTRDMRLYIPPVLVSKQLISTYDLLDFFKRKCINIIYLMNHPEYRTQILYILRESFKNQLINVDFAKKLLHGIAYNYFVDIEENNRNLNTFLICLPTSTEEQQHNIEKNRFLLNCIFMLANTSECVHDQHLLLVANGDSNDDHQFFEYVSRIYDDNMFDDKIELQYRFIYQFALYQPAIEYLHKMYLIEFSPKPIEFDTTNIIKFKYQFDRYPRFPSISRTGEYGRYLNLMNRTNMSFDDVRRSMIKFYYRFLLETIFQQLCIYVYNNNKQFEEFIEQNYKNSDLLEKYFIERYQPRNFTDSTKDLKTWVLRVGLPYYGLYGDDVKEFIYFKMIGKTGKFQPHDLTLKTSDIFKMLRICLKSSKEQQNIVKYAIEYMLHVILQKVEEATTTSERKFIHNVITKLKYIVIGFNKGAQLITFLKMMLQSQI